MKSKFWNHYCSYSLIGQINSNSLKSKKLKKWLIYKKKYISHHFVKFANSMGGENKHKK